MNATFIIQNSVYVEPHFPLVDDVSLAIEVTGNGVIALFDTSLILQYEVVLIDEIACDFVFK